MKYIPFEEKKYTAENFPARKLYEEVSKYPDNTSMQIFVNKLRTQEYDEEILFNDDYTVKRFNMSEAPVQRGTGFL